jgi:hypothetical protein
MSLNGVFVLLFALLGVLFTEHASGKHVSRSRYALRHHSSTVLCFIIAMLDYITPRPEIITSFQGRTAVNLLRVSLLSPKIT